MSKRVLCCRPLMNRHADKSSLEERLRRNRYTVQRGQASTEEHFAKK